MDHPFGIILACLRRLEDGASDVPPTPHDDLGAAAGSSCLTAAGPLPLHGEARMGGHTLDDARLLSFDIEISDVFDLDPGEDMERYAPFHISVAATAVPGGEERHWLSVDEAGEPALNLTRRRAHELLEYLAEKLDEGFALCAWNGLHFDMQWIGHHAGDMALAAEIALEIYDPMFQFFNDQGYPVGLASVAAGFDIAQKKLMNGADAPKEWRAGRYDLVKRYVLGDCQITHQVVRAIRDAGRIQWVNRNGERKSKSMKRLMTVGDVIEAPGPDQSWMDRPLLKASFHQWVDEALSGTQLELGF